MGREVEWLYGLNFVIPVVSRPLHAIVVHCDSHTDIDKISSRKYNVKTKWHLQVRVKSIRGFVFDRVIAIEFIGTQDNTVDHLIKGVELDVVLNTRLGMGLISHHDISTAGIQYT